MIFVNTFKIIDATSYRNERTFEKPDEDLPNNKWLLLMVRIKDKSKVTITIECKKMFEFDLRAGPIEKFPLGGSTLTVSSR